MSIGAASPSYFYSSNSNYLPIGDDGSFAFGFWFWAHSGAGGSLIGDSPTFSEYFGGLGPIPINKQFINMSFSPSYPNPTSGLLYFGLTGSTYTYNYTQPIASGWNSVVVVNSGLSERRIYLNGHRSTHNNTASTIMDKLLYIYYVTSTYEKIPFAELTWWGSGITDTEARLFGSGMPPSTMNNNPYSYWPLYDANNTSDVIGNGFPFYGIGSSASGYRSHPPVINISRPLYPSQVNNSLLNVFLKCGTSEDCLPYDSGNGAYTSDFGLGFDNQLCGNPPGWHMNLLLDGRQVSSGINDLYMYGFENESGIVNMLVKAIDFLPDDSGNALPNSAMNVYLRGPIAHPISSSDVPVFMWSTTHSGLYNKSLLYLRSDASGQYTKNINFIVKNELSENYTSTINTFLKAIGNSDGSITQTGEIPIVVYNGAELESGYMTMSLYGPSGTDGAIPLSGTMNLFMHRGNESLSHTHSVYLSGPTQSSDDFELYLEGQPRPTGTLPVYLFGGDSGVNDLVKLYTHGF